MINFVIYEDEEYFDKLYEDIIHKFMGKVMISIRYIILQNITKIW